ncbi:MAG TPA: hypothetical protein VMD55_10240 [Terracidiphilus sp.]|nr:hypothetical protein [Terracidiphilus sp.]
MKRPIPVTVVGVLFILVGVLSTGYHVLEFRVHPPTWLMAVGICAVGVLAVVAGLYLLQGQNWARWLALLWMAFHVAISVRDPMGQLVFHSALFILFAYILLGREAREYFRQDETGVA